MTTKELIDCLRGRMSYIKKHSSNIPLHQDGDFEFFKEIIERLEEHERLKVINI